MPGRYLTPRGRYIHGYPDNVRPVTVGPDPAAVWGGGASDGRGPRVCDAPAPAPAARHAVPPCPRPLPPPTGNTGAPASGSSQPCPPPPPPEWPSHGPGQA